MTFRLVAVDGHVLLRWGLADLLAGSDDLELAGDTASAAEAEAMVDALRPDVVTFDVTLADDAWAMAHRLRARHARLGLVLLTAVGDDALLYRASDEGLSAYLSKAAPAATLVSVLRHAAMAPLTFTAPGQAGALARRRGSTGLLSQREREVLALMREGISLPGIALRLHVSEATVKTYVARLYTKLRVNNRSQALMAAVNQGLLTSAA